MTTLFYARQQNAAHVLAMAYRRLFVCLSGSLSLRQTHP